jgi:N,N'-diacetyllegionaminate synthase
MIEIIAEIGVNHNGDYMTAAKLVEMAKSAGCDTVKFQCWNTERVYPPERWAEIKRLELSRAVIKDLKSLATNYGLRFLCTPDDAEDARFLKSINVERIKIGSSNVTNLPLLCEVGNYGLPIILSSGACSWEEFRAAISAVWVAPELTLMHCVSAYPARLCELNLTMVKVYDKRFKRITGFSDHTVGTEAALVALGLGARVFEKHLTLDRFQPGPDHLSSFTPYQMREYCSVLREAAVGLGDGVKQILPCEADNRREYERFVACQAGAAC